MVQADHIDITAHYFIMVDTGQNWIGFDFSVVGETRWKFRVRNLYWETSIGMRSFMINLYCMLRAGTLPFDSGIRFLATLIILLMMTLARVETFSLDLSLLFCHYRYSHDLSGLVIAVL